jgi:hypothetical protein
MNRRLSILVALVAIFALAGSASAAPSGGSVIYSSLVTSPLPGNLSSVGVESSYFSEFGNAVTFSASKNRSLSSVIVTMSSLACQSGNWSLGDCLTTPGATFSVPITFNVYNPSPDGIVPGGLIASATQTFAIPYRPSASTNCPGGRWYDKSQKKCFSGLATNITFNFHGEALPDSVVFGISYNTTTNGPSPIGQTACNSSAGGCPYDSLNISLSTSVSVGTNTYPGKVWQNNIFGSNYCDNGLAGTGTFRLDSPTVACWGASIPAVQFKAAR